jgi:hypothetical protein
MTYYLITRHDAEIIFLMVAAVIKIEIRSNGILIIRNNISNTPAKETIVDVIEADTELKI